MPTNHASAVPASLRRLSRVKGLRRAVVLLGLLVVLGVVFASLDLQPSLRRMQLAVLSGVEGGNYHKVVTQLADAAVGRCATRSCRGSGTPPGATA